MMSMWSSMPKTLCFAQQLTEMIEAATQILKQQCYMNQPMIINEEYWGTFSLTARRIMTKHLSPWQRLKM